MKKMKDPLRYAMRDMVYDEFKDRMVAGVIVVTREEMTNVFINLLAEFIKFQKERRTLNDKR